MRHSGALVAVLTALLLGSALGGSWTAAPITAWGPGSLLGSRAHFESAPAAKVLEDLLSLATSGAAPAASSPLAGLINTASLLQQQVRPRAVVLFVGSAEGGAGVEAQLRALTGAAGSWLQLPNAVHQAPGSHVLAGLQGAAGGAERLQVLGSCSGAPAVLPATPDALRQHLALAPEEGATSVAVVCAEGSGEEEAALLAAAQSALAALTDSYLLIHTTAGGAAGAKAAEQRRRLLASGSGAANAEPQTCDAKCKVQVKYLEGLIVLITIALAVGVGFCCMHAIKTPTRFETPKETRSAHHE